jgi:hypothetical protein
MHAEEDPPRDFTPLFFEAGRALYDCQGLEMGLALLLFLLNRLGVVQLTPQRQGELVSSTSKKTAGQLLNQLEGFTSLEPRVHGTLRAALKARNCIAHRFLVDNLERMVQPKQRAEVVSDLRHLREQLGSARVILNQLIDAANQKLGGPPLQAEFERHWQSLADANAPGNDEPGTVM